MSAITKLLPHLTRQEAKEAFQTFLDDRNVDALVKKVGTVALLPSATAFAHEFSIKSRQTVCSTLRKTSLEPILENIEEDEVINTFLLALHHQCHQLIQNYGTKGQKLLNKELEAAGILTIQTYQEINRWIQEKKDKCLIAFFNLLNERYPKLFEHYDLKILLGTSPTTMACLIRSIFDSLRPQLNQLRELDLFNGQLTSLPPEISYFTNLERLYLNNNCLKKLPPEIGQLTNLRYLLLQNNYLISLPFEITKLEQLEWLDLKDNRFTSIPEEVFSLKTLIRLNLDRNKIKVIPSQICELPHLSTLTLTQNKIKSIPCEIEQLTHLTTLMVSKNKLTALPPQLFNLRNLGYLDIHNNSISSLPDGIIVALYKLKHDFHCDIDADPDVLQYI